MADCARGNFVFPTHVGVFLTFIYVTTHSLESSPRTWGCFSHEKGNRLLFLVFPTHVGVFLPVIGAFPMTKCLPHARGGVSTLHCMTMDSTESSPRTWGCFHGFDHIDVGKCVFPTHVGVFLGLPLSSIAMLRLPHARGGVSSQHTPVTSSSMSSPRTWGCFWACAIMGQSSLVFPTHVGVFPSLSLPILRRSCLPHARGGVSEKTAF